MRKYTQRDSKMGIGEEGSSDFLAGASDHCQRQGASEDEKYRVNRRGSIPIFESRCVYILLTLALATSCMNNSLDWKLIAENQAYSYSIDNQQYVIIVAEDNGLSDSAAKKEAKRQAAQVTIDNGYRYFSIVSQETTEVMKNTQSQQSGVPSNIYQELIFEKKFGRTTEEKSSSYKTIPAIRLVIECYSEKPATKKSYDAESILNK